MATQLRGPVRPYLAVVESGSSVMAGLEQISLNVLGTEKAETFRLWQMVSTMYKPVLLAAGGNLAPRNIKSVRRSSNGPETACRAVGDGRQTISKVAVDEVEVRPLFTSALDHRPVVFLISSS